MRFRSKPYRQFIASLPCLVSGRIGETQAAHLRTGTGGGMGLKPSDIYCVPLSFKEHKRQHDIGERTFWEPYGGVEAVKALCEKIHPLWIEGKIDEIYRELARFRCT